MGRKLRRAKSRANLYEMQVVRHAHERRQERRKKHDVREQLIEEKEALAAKIVAQRETNAFLVRQHKETLARMAAAWAVEPGDAQTRISASRFALCVS